MSVRTHGPTREVLIYDFAAFAPKATERLEHSAAFRNAPKNDITTNREGAPSPTCFSVPDLSEIDDLGRAISAAADISTGDRPIVNLPVPSAIAPNAPEYSASVQAAWFLVRTFLSIRSAERRQAVLNYVAEQARSDKG